MILYESISDVTKQFEKKEVSPGELVKELVERLEKLEPDLNAFISLNPDLEAEARLAETKILQGESGPLTGIPISIKDLILTEKLETTGGSKVAKSFFAKRQNAPVVELLLQAGALLIGKTNLHEFAYGITSENEYYGTVCNPWDLSRVAGGSSGGSAASLAVGIGFGSIGTDTRGSIRIPSACCGTCGLKPTYGYLSTSGVYPLSHSLDHVGPMARSVSDLRFLMAVLTGDEGYLANGDFYPGDVRLGVCPFYLEKIDPEIEQYFESALQLIRNKTSSFFEVQIEYLNDALEASDIISKAEAVFYHESDLESQATGFGPKVRERLLGGFSVKAHSYLKALQIKEMATTAFEEVFQKVDCLVAPAIPIPAPKMGTQVVDWPSGIEESLVNCMVRLNAPQNVSGIPCLTIPCGLTAAGLPVGLQLMSWKKQEKLLLSIGEFFQSETNWHLQRPPLSV